ncbi:MAG: hypothetical protein QOD98_2117, partial [Nocardioidaceae bacterium]|nr:hypothetical protein [Nocardioidaceae bacterium]
MDRLARRARDGRLKLLGAVGPLQVKSGSSG